MLTIWMAGQVVVPLSKNAKEGDTMKSPWTGALVCGGRHKATLAVPLESLRKVDPPFGQHYCTYTVLEGGRLVQYAMLEVAGMNISVGKGDTWTLGHVADVVDLVETGKPTVAVSLKDVLKIGAYSARLNLGGGHLEQAMLSDQKTDTPITPSGYVAACLRATFHNANSNGTFEVAVKSEVREHILTLSSDCNLFLTTLCGWDGAKNEYLDFEAGEALLPRTPYVPSFPKVKYVAAPTQPESAGCFSGIARMDP